MSDRNLREPGRAMGQTMESMARKLEVLYNRSLKGVARTALEPGVWWQDVALGSVSLTVPSGAWMAYIQGTFAAYFTAGARIGLGLAVAPTSTGVPEVGNPDFLISFETLNWTPATDPSTGNPYPTERTLCAIGWVKAPEEVTVSLVVAVIPGDPNMQFPTWYAGHIILLPH